ncbi:hypothetical protein HB848_08500 [Listeria rocourtiae]|uniref:hypothetical protein n=1 Tax=Listeria rocourtiae TaxID=647910 RepID=UPI00162A099E|nr:hypothetical protein [Listeria rocourtiae]MBC1435378.1 hypothetical protein [Listeria rocourtiae]
MKKSIKFCCTSLALAMGLSVITPSISSYAAERNLEKVIYENKKMVEFSSALSEALKEDGVTQQQWNNYIAEIKAAVAQETTPRWKGAAIKKAMKFAIKHVNVIPSKKVRDVVKKYGGKIIKAIDTIDTYTWYGIAKALTKVGIPDKYADLIADFLVTFIL